MHPHLPHYPGGTIMGDKRTGKKKKAERPAPSAPALNQQIPAILPKRPGPQK
jgi:hypothetical protein